MKQSIFFIILFLSFLVFAVNKVEAKSLSFGVYPPLIKLEAKPPTNLKTSIRLQNFADEPITLGITFKPFTTYEDGKIKYLNNYKQIEPILKKIEILDDDTPIEDITLSPKQQKIINLKLDLPSDEKSEDYYFSIIFTSTYDDLASKGNTSGIIGGIATNIILSIKKEEFPKATIEEFSTQSFIDKGPLVFNLRLKNTAEHVIEPKGTIAINNMFGQPVDKIDLPPVNILSKTSRRISSPLDTLDTFDTLDTQSIAWSKELLIGPYSATLNLSLSDNGPIYTRTVSFFVFPTKATIGIFIVLIIVLFIRNRIKSRLS